MRIGILGSGLLGGKLGTLLARAGHEVVFSYARSPQKLKRLARQAGANAHAGTPAEAARHGEALLLAVPWPRLADVLGQAGDVAGKVVVNCSLPMNAGNTALAVAGTSSGLEELAKTVAKARVVAAFNTVPSEVLAGVYRRRRRADRPSLVYCGDDRRAKSVAVTSFATSASIRLMPARPGSPAISSRSRSWSRSLSTRARAARPWRTGSSGSGASGPPGLPDQVSVKSGDFGL
jgi:8-hydroxy-5-deazaflavin:NADPH oxidoreductase